MPKSAITNAVWSEVENLKLNKENISSEEFEQQLKLLKLKLTRKITEDDLKFTDQKNYNNLLSMFNTVTVS